MDSATVVSPSANKDYYKKKNKCFDKSMELIAFLGNYDRQTVGDRTTEQEPDMKGHREVTLPIIFRLHN